MALLYFAAVLLGVGFRLCRRVRCRALIDGQRDPTVLADQTPTPIHNPALVQALTGAFTGHKALLARVHLNLIDRHQDHRGDHERIERQTAPFRAFRDLIHPSPGISTATAEVILAEFKAIVASLGGILK